MTKYCIVSDIHVEFSGLKVLEDMEFPEHDILVVAGDLCPISDGRWEPAVSILNQKSKNCIYVFGNHEYYGNNLKDCQNLLQSLEPELTKRYPNVTLVYQPYKTIGNILAGTMWFPYDEEIAKTFFIPGCHPYQEKISTVDKFKPRWSDFDCIFRSTPELFDKENAAFKDELWETIPEIVITHHMPTYKNIVPKWAGSLGNRFFVGEKDEDIESLLISRDKGPKLWIYGHGHDCNNITIGKTETVANPMGYPWAIPPYWKPIVVEV